MPPPTTTTRAVSVICSGARETGVHRGWPETGARPSSLSLDRAADAPGDHGEEHEQDGEEHEPGARDLGKRPQPHRQRNGGDQPEHRDGYDRVVPGSHPDVSEDGPPRPDGLRIVAPSEPDREGKIAPATESAETERHDGDDHAAQDHVPGPGPKGERTAGRHGV